MPTLSLAALPLLLAPTPFQAVAPRATTGAEADERCATTLLLEPVTGTFRYDGEPYAMEGLRRRLAMRTESRWRDRPRPEGGITRDLAAIEGSLTVTDLDEPKPGAGEPMDWTGPLAGSVVELARDDEGRLEASFADEQPPGSPAAELDAARVLAPLTLGALDAWWPPDAEEEGASAPETWDVPLSALDALLAPLGDVAVGERMRELFTAGGLTGFTAPCPPLDLTPWLGDEREGRLVARLAPAAAESGQVTVVVDVDVVLRAARVDWATGILRKESRMDVERYALELRLDGTAHVTFDEVSRRALTATLEADARTRLDAYWLQSKKPLEALIEHAGTLAVEREWAPDGR